MSDSMNNEEFNSHRFRRMPIRRNCSKRLGRWMIARPNRSTACFEADAKRFCLPVLDVEEVLEWPNTTRLPLAPAYVVGVFNLRGSIVPLIDIAMNGRASAGIVAEACRCRGTARRRTASR